MVDDVSGAMNALHSIASEDDARKAFRQIVELRVLIEGAERKAALQLADSGVSWREIADLANRSHNSARVAYLKEPSKTTVPDGPPYKQAVAAELLGRTPSQINDLMRREGEGVWWAHVAVIKSDGDDGTRRMVTDLEALRDRLSKKRR